MPSAAWLSASPYPATHAADKSERRSHGTVRRIMDKPTDIVVKRGSSFLASQTVRIEGKAGTSQEGSRLSGNQTTYTRLVTVFGIRDHPTIPDLNIAAGDRFGTPEGNFVVLGVTFHAGEVQATAERLQT